MTTPINPPPQRADSPQGMAALSQAVRLIFERVRYIDPAPVRWTSGSGSPESNVTGNVGDLYTRTDGGASTTLYVKESGAGTDTGWSAK